MSTWDTQYLASLQVRDRREKADYDLFKSYTKLADRTAALENKPLQAPSLAKPPASPRSPSAPGSPAIGDRAKAAAAPSEALLAQLRHELGEAQRTKVDLQARLKTTTEELDKLKAKSQNDKKRLQELTTERDTLVTRVRDRDEELRGKAKLLENVQDEMISLNLQLNMAEKRAQEVQKENRELIDRWMARMGKEAEAMNNASKFS